MGIGVNINGAIIKDTLEGVGKFANAVRSAITGELSPEKKAELLEMASQAESSSMQAQATINSEEAKSPSLFVSGWRPAVGWVCVMGFGQHFIVNPNFVWIYQFIKGQVVAAPALDIGALLSLLVGMLGLGGYRTYEKAKGKARN